MKGWTKNANGRWVRADGVYEVWLQERPLHEPPVWQLAITKGNWDADDQRFCGYQTVDQAGDLWAVSSTRGGCFQYARERDRRRAAK